MNSEAYEEFMEAVADQEPEQTEQEQPQELGELEPIEVEAVPAVIEAQFDQWKAELEQRLEPYRNTVVTADSVTDAKKLAADLNKIATAINTRRKEIVDEVSGPIKTFDGAMKELVALVKDSRTLITDQIERFNTETIAEVEKLLAEERHRLVCELEVRAIPDSISIAGIAKPTMLTPTGKLAKPGKDKVAALVRAQKDIESRADMRLLELSNRCYEAGLKAPLTKEHVEAFLSADDENYTRQCDQMIAAELKRQTVLEEKTRAEIDADLARQPSPETPGSPQTAQESAQQEQEPPVPEEPAEPGTERFEVSCIFHIEAPEGKFNEAQIKEGLRVKMKQAGITSLAATYVKKLN